MLSRIADINISTRNVITSKKEKENIFKYWEAYTNL